MIQRSKYLLLGVILTVLGISITGCKYFPEASFALSSESRLPKWIVLSPGLSRADVSVTMNYYVTPWGRSAQFLVRDQHNQVINKQNGKLICAEPFQLQKSLQGIPSDYPAYEAITVNSMTEIIEHRKMEPTFYITDDPTVWNQYESIGCG